MGTVVSFDIRAEAQPSDALAEACAWLHRVDATFSTYRTTSEISFLNRGDLQLADASDVVREVVARCLELRTQTRGAFDADIAGTLDPSGYVKGWAAERGDHVRSSKAQVWPRRLRSVTVTAPDLGTADAWATAIFAWGHDGLDLLADAPQHVEALAVLEDRIVQTPGFPDAACVRTPPAEA